MESIDDPVGDNSKKPTLMVVDDDEMSLVLYNNFLNEYFDDPGKMLDAVFLKGYQWPFDPRKVKNFGSSLIDILVKNKVVKA